MSEQMLQFDFLHRETSHSVENAGINLARFLEKEYLKNFLDQLDIFEKTTVQFGRAGSLSKIDTQKVREYIHEKIPQLINRIRVMVAQEGVVVVEDNSMRDVLGNAVMATVQRTGMEKAVSSFVTDDGTVRYYIDMLCNDDEKLRAEIGTRDGFLSECKEYFTDVVTGGKEEKNYPRGTKKMAYFKFFSELDRGDISEENVENMLATLDDDYVDKAKIKQSILIKKFH